MKKALIGSFKEEKFELNRVLLKYRECENYQSHMLNSFSSKMCASAKHYIMSSSEKIRNQLEITNFNQL